MLSGLPACLFKNPPSVASATSPFPPVPFSLVRHQPTMGMAMVVSMEMCVQNLYPQRSPGLPGIREKLSLNYEPLKRLRCEQFSTFLSFARDQPNPLSSRTVLARESERRSHVFRFAGAGKPGNEFPRENAGVMDTSCAAPAFLRGSKRRVPSFNDTRDISYFTLILTRETLLYTARIKARCANSIFHTTKFYAPLRCTTINSMDIKNYLISLKIFKDISHIFILKNIYVF